MRLGESVMRVLRLGNTWLCSCGNATDNGGFETCKKDRYGWYTCQPTEDEWDGLHWMCTSCSSVFYVADVFAIGTVQETDDME